MSRYGWKLDDVLSLTLEQIVEFGKFIVSKPTIERLISSYIEDEIKNKNTEIERNWNKLLSFSG